MSFRFSTLWRWDGTIDRGPYAVIGFVGLAIKHNLDRALATAVFRRHWAPFSYWIPPGKAMRITSLTREDQQFLAAMLLLALPFIWVGVVLTARRLRSAGLPMWLVTLFFLPVLNLLFFAVLCVLPPQQSDAGEGLAGKSRRGNLLDRIIPERAVGSAAMAIGFTLFAGLVLTLLSTVLLLSYGWGLFVALPFCLGLTSVMIYGYHRPRGYKSCLGIAVLSTLLLAVVLFAVAVEGAICLIMAAPLAAALALMGGTIGYFIQRRYWGRKPAPAMLSIVLLFVPAFMGLERAYSARPDVFAVRTAIEIDAKPETVWHEVVAFSQIPEPQEWIFRLGIAYPMRAEIRGHGPGAERHCVFSTGAFVEPIEVWDDARLLKFSVASNPAPMQEWTPYADIQPPHLHGFLVSEGGQFLLTPLPGGRTRLEGTTWYRHTLWPSAYWRAWSDFIIHRIHLRVLRHIERLAVHPNSE